MTWVIICGIFSLSFAIIHVLFWKLFRWKEDLQQLSMVNRAVIQILNLRMVYIFLLISFLCFRFPTELIQTELGNAIMVGCSLFWIGRLIEQFIFLRVNHWKVHVLSASFLLGSILFLLPIL